MIQYSTRYWILGEANDFVNLAKIVRHFLYIFYRDVKGERAAKRIVFILSKLLHRVERLILWRLLSRDNSINSSRVLETSLWRARLGSIREPCRENSRITMVEKFMITTTLYYGQSYTIPVQCIVTVFTIALMVINDNC